MQDDRQSPQTGQPSSPDATIAVVLGLLGKLLEELGQGRQSALAGPETDLDRLGLGSLERVELTLRAGAAFGLDLPDDAVAARTPRELAAWIESSQPTSPASRASRPKSPEPPPRGTDRPVEDFDNLVDLALSRAETDPNRIHARIRLGDRDEIVVRRGDLTRDALAIAAGLRARGLQQAEPVTLMLPTGRDYLATFLGIQFGGGLPVPLYPPLRQDRLREYAERQRAIFNSCRARLLVVPDGEDARSLRDSIAPGLQLVSPSQLASNGTSPTTARTSGPSPALVQYTSGSTGQPRGVLLSHRAILANIMAIGRAVAVRGDDVVVSWLPLYHDMGLIGSWLFALAHGIEITLLPPTSFLVRPERWLRAIDQHRGSLAAAPNFGYELCARRVPDEVVADLHLSSWRAALNGSEPVRPSTLARFREKFAPAGFAAESLRPVYGLAESSVALCFPPSRRLARIDRISRSTFETSGRAVQDPVDAALEFVSVGRPLTGHAVRIIDDTGAPCPPRSEGRIVFRGSSTMDGYYRDEEASRRVEVRIDDLVWIDTGDLGYLDDDGELFVTGRRKDLIIRGGRNIVPTQVEEAARSVEGVREAAAFGCDDPDLGTEKLIVVVETRRRADRLAHLRTAIVEAITTEISLPPDEVVMRPPGSLPRTSSGKLRRSATRDAWLTGELERARDRAGVDLVLRTLAGRLGRSGRATLDAVGRLLGGLGACCLGLPFLVAGSLLARLSPRAVVPTLSRHLARILLLSTGILVRRPSAPLPPGGVVLAVNHASYLDVLVLIAALSRPLCFVAKSEVADWPLVGTFVRRGGHLLVDRSDAASGLDVADRLAREAARGQPVVLFPEGTFAAESGIRPFRLGAFVAAARSGTPILPVGLRGTRALLPASRRLPRPGRVEVRLGSLLPAPAGETMVDLTKVRDATRQALATLTGEPQLDAVVAGLAGLPDQTPK